MKTITTIALLLVVATIARAESITTPMFDARGNKIGSATQTGDTTIFYDARGNKTGSSTDSGSRTNFYDARGNLTGSIRNDDRRK
jgi:YD repeat-containing protein